MCLENCFIDFQYLNEFPVYIDVNNVSYFRSNQNEKPILSDILSLIDHLIREIGFPKENIHCICDPALKHYIDKPVEFRALLKEGLTIEAPKVADEMILSFALKHNFCFIISNDKFREYSEQLPSRKWIEDRRVSFMFIGNEICLSPNIDYKQIDLLPITGDIIEKNNKKTTLEVLNQIEETKGVLDLYQITKRR